MKKKLQNKRKVTSDNKTEENPAWLETVLEGLGGGDPDNITKATDETLLAIRGVGPATLEEIREEYPYYHRSRGADQVTVKIRPMRGIGGVGGAGEMATMDRDEAERYEGMGYVDILE